MVIGKNFKQAVWRAIDENLYLKITYYIIIHKRILDIFSPFAQFSPDDQDSYMVKIELTSALGLQFLQTETIEAGELNLETKQILKAWCSGPLLYS